MQGEKFDKKLSFFIRKLAALQNNGGLALTRQPPASNESVVISYGIVTANI